MSDTKNTPHYGGVNMENLNNVKLNAENIVGGDYTVHHHTTPIIRACPQPPPKPDHFAGRDTNFQAVLMTLQHGNDCAITAVHGGAGLGKTTLAQMVAATVHEKGWFRAVLWTPVNQAPTVEDLLLQWAILGDPSFNPRTRKATPEVVRALLTNLIAEKCPTCEGNRVLVVLDNIWEDGIETIKHLRDAVPSNSTVLVTSRFDNVVNKLRITSRQRLDYLDPIPATDFLAAYLPNAPHGNLQRLAIALGGFPLAMELAAAYIDLISDDSGMDPSRALTKVLPLYEDGIFAETSFANLHFEEGDNPERNLTLSLELTYNSLTSDDQKRFVQLGALPFDTDFDILLLGQLWQEQDTSIVEAYCRVLRLAALITPTQEQGWYRQHRLLRAYAGALLQARQDSESIIRRALQSLNDVAQYLSRWGHNRRALKYLDGILARALILKDQYWQFTSLTNSGLVWFYLGEYVKASEILQQALHIAEFRKDNLGIATTLHSIGMVWHELGKERRAIKFFEKSLIIIRNLRRKDLEATILNSLGRSWLNLDRKQKALKLYKKALFIFRFIQEPMGIGICLNNIGHVWKKMGNNEKALSFYEDSLPFREISGDTAGKAITEGNISIIYAEIDKVDLAVEYMIRSVQTMKFIEHPFLKEAEQNLNDLYYRVASECTTFVILTEQQLRSIANNSIAVGTVIPYKREEWCASLKNIRIQIIENENNQNKITFIDALLGILNGQLVDLHVNNPYRTLVTGIQKAIADYTPPK